MIIFPVLLGFPVALSFAWAFELTPEGLKREEDVDRSRPREGAARRLTLVTVCLLVLAVGFAVVERFVGIGEEAGVGSVSEDRKGAWASHRRPTA